MELTRNGVCYNLIETPYTYEWRGMVYHFSSPNHRAKFIRELKKKEMWLNDSLSRRFKVTIKMELLADIQLYTQVETRGFYVVSNDQCEYTSPQQMLFVINQSTLGIVNDA